MYNVEDVLPQVVVLGDVFIEAITVFVKLQKKDQKNSVGSYRATINGADVANVLHIQVSEGLSVTQLSEGVDDDTEKDVEHDNDADHHVSHLKNEFHEVTILKKG